MMIYNLSFINNLVIYNKVQMFLLIFYLACLHSSISSKWRRLPFNVPLTQHL